METADPEPISGDPECGHGGGFESADECELNGPIDQAEQHGLNSSGDGADATAGLWPETVPNFEFYAQ